MFPLSPILPSSQELAGQSFLSPTWVWVLQLLFKPGEGRTQRLGVLEEHFVHDQHCLLPDVRLRVRHLWGQRVAGDSLTWPAPMTLPHLTPCSCPLYLPALRGAKPIGGCSHRESGSGYKVIMCGPVPRLPSLKPPPGQSLHWHWWWGYPLAHQAPGGAPCRYYELSSPQGKPHKLYLHLLSGPGNCPTSCSHHKGVDGHGGSQWSSVYNRYLLDLDGGSGLCPLMVFSF